MESGTMLPEKFVDLYALGSRIQDTLVAERDVVLTYVLKILSDHGMLEHLAFKGGTCIRKHLFGNTGRFSEDLDFTTPFDPERFFAHLQSPRVGWENRRHLVRSDRPIRPEDILSQRLAALTFLSRLTHEEIALSADARHHNLMKLKDRLIEELRKHAET
jgi:hypothetical protein